jgi:hypothetical protein
MRITLGAAACAALLLIVVVGAPALPVLVGALGAVAVLAWRARRPS